MNIGSINKYWWSVKAKDHHGSELYSIRKKICAKNVESDNRVIWSKDNLMKCLSIKIFDCTKRLFRERKLTNWSRPTLWTIHVDEYSLTKIWSPMTVYVFRQHENSHSFGTHGMLPQSQYITSPIEQPFNCHLRPRNCQIISCSWRHTRIFGSIGVTPFEKPVSIVVSWGRINSDITFEISINIGTQSTILTKDLKHSWPNRARILRWIINRRSRSRKGREMAALRVEMLDIR